MHTIQFLLVAVLAAAPAPRARIADVTAMPMAIGTSIQVSCSFKGAPLAAAPTARYAIAIENDASPGRWSSGWMPMPPAGADGRGMLMAMVPFAADTLTADRVGQVFITASVDDGSGKIRNWTASFYRWSDRMFHNSYEYTPSRGNAVGFATIPAGFDPNMITSAPLASGTFDMMVSGQSLVVSDVGAGLEPAVPETFSSWGALKARYGTPIPQAARVGIKASIGRP